MDSRIPLTSGLRDENDQDVAAGTLTHAPFRLTPSVSHGRHALHDIRVTGNWAEGSSDGGRLGVPGVAHIVGARQWLLLLASSLCLSQSQQRQ